MEPAHGCFSPCFSEPPQTGANPPWESWTQIWFEKTLLSWGSKQLPQNFFGRKPGRSNGCPFWLLCSNKMDSGFDSWCTCWFFLIYQGNPILFPLKGHLWADLVYQAPRKVPQPVMDEGERLRTFPPSNKRRRSKASSRAFLFEPNRIRPPKCCPQLPPKSKPHMVAQNFQQEGLITQVLAFVSTSQGNPFWSYPVSCATAQ